MTKLAFAIAALSIFNFACSTAKVRILPGETVNKVVSTDYEADDAEEAAIKEANDYCKQYNKRAAFVNAGNKSQYTGTMNENTRRTVKNASRAAMILSGPVGYGSGSGAAGGVLGGAGVIGESMTHNRDYRAEWDFKCVQ